jgi:hypothetical protein
MSEQPQLPPVDPGNPFTQPAPSSLTTFQVARDGVGLVGMTVRTVGATVTVFLDRDAAVAWAGQIQAEARGVSPLIVANGATIPPVDPRVLRQN